MALYIPCCLSFHSVSSPSLCLEVKKSDGNICGSGDANISPDVSLPYDPCHRLVQPEDGLILWRAAWPSFLGLQRKVRLLTTYPTVELQSWSHKFSDASSLESTSFLPTELFTIPKPLMDSISLSGLQLPMRRVSFNLTNWRCTSRF